jgi:hypothetical protein
MTSAGIVRLMMTMTTTTMESALTNARQVLQVLLDVKTQS